jgi:ketosteroid isomerase-like protein
MPDWKDKKYKPLQRFVASFEKAMAARDADRVTSHFSRSAILHRADMNHKGISAIRAWYEEAFQRFKSTSFVMEDASAGIFPNKHAICILWFVLKQKGKSKKLIHVECLELEQTRSKWLCTRCFGIGYSPIEHKQSFR